MKKLLIALCIIGVLAAGGWAWIHQRAKNQDGALVLQGSVDIRQISLAFDGSGRVVEMRAEEGDRVHAGAVLAVLDTRLLALQAEQAQAQIDAQQQSLLRMRNGARPEEIAQTRSRVTAAEADAAQAGQDLERLQGISANTQGRGVSAQDLDRAGSRLQVAQARVAEQRDALALIELGPRTEDLAAAEAQLKVAQSQLAMLQYRIAQGELRAPADAIVRSRLLEPGDMATPQRPVFALALMQPKWVRVYVGEPDLGRIRSRMEARIVTDSAPDKSIAGRIGYISSVAEFTPKTVQTEELRTSLVYQVRVLVDDPHDVLRLGQPVTVHLEIKAAQ